MRRIIREVEPPKPSTRLQHAWHAREVRTGATRHTEPAKLGALVRGDLDWIVMKALEKDRTRRYETANGLAMDVERFLADKTVSATPPSAGYRFRKFARRNKAVLRVAASITAVLLASTIVSSWLAVPATRAGKKSERERAHSSIRGDTRQRPETPC